MPQPLSKVSPKAGVAFGPRFMEKRPELAQIVAFSIAHFAYVELQFSFIYHLVVGTDAAVAFAMLKTSQARRQNVRNVKAAADHSLNTNERAFIEQVLSEFLAVAKARDAFAHNLWGVSDQLPDALLMIEPDYYHHMSIVNERASREGRAPTVEELLQSNDSIMVYRRADLERELKRINDANDIMRTTVGLLALPKGPQRDEKCHHLAGLIHSR